MIALIVYLLSIPILWVCFVIVMRLKVSPPAKPLYYLAYAFFIAAYAWDVLCNFLVLPVIFLELPHEFTVSARLQRLVNDNRPSWRRSLAVWFATTLINPYSPTPHIHL
jgi:hypothetical protein